MKGYEPGTTLPSHESEEPASETLVPTLTVVSHPDLKQIGSCLYLEGLARGRSYPISRVKPDFAPPGKALGRPLGDGFLSREPFVMAAIRNGGLRLSKGACRSQIKVNGKIIDEGCSFSDSEIEPGVVLTLARRLVLLLHFSRCQRRPAPNHRLIGESDCIHALRLEIGKVADLPTPILLRGPSGSGKELVARAIHEAGGKNRPFVPVNMGAVPPNLAASELFGAVKGAYTGSDRNQLGFFRAAAGGTLFLDEIGEASLEVQVLLLRALESGEVTPLGAQKSVRVNTRLIAATDADLELKMEEASFKAPLFHRLSGYEISVPPLSSRREDIGRLFLHFASGEPAYLMTSAALSNPRGAPWIPAGLMERMLHFSWPGNVRQLANVVRQLMIGCRGEGSLSLLPKIDKLFSGSRSLEASRPKSGRKPSEIPVTEIKETLRANGWDLKASAADLNISRGALYQRVGKIPTIRAAKDLSLAQIQAALDDCGGQSKKAADRLEVSARAFRRRMTALGVQRRKSSQKKS